MSEQQQAAQPQQPTTPRTIQEVIKIATKKAEAAERAQSAESHETPGGAEPSAESQSTPPPTVAAESAAPPGDSPPTQGQDAEKRRQLEALAKELGLGLDERGIAPIERVGFKAEKRKFHERKARELAEIQAQKERLAKLVKAADAYERGDLIGAIDAVGWDPDELNKAQVARLDPGYQAELRVKQLEAKIAREEQERQAAAARDRQENSYKQICAQHRAEIVETLKASTDPVMARASADPYIVETARSIAEKAYRENGEEMDSVEAAKLALAQARRVYENVRRVFEDAHQAGDPAPKPGRGYDTAAGVQPARPAAKPPKAISPRTAAEGGTSGARRLTYSEWHRETVRRMREAAEQE